MGAEDLPSEPTEEERQLLALLIRGLADDDARAKLGWSRRTFERRLKSVFDKLGARSRLEAGYLLAKARWLDDDRTGSGVSSSGSGPSGGRQG